MGSKIREKTKCGTPTQIWPVWQTSLPTCLSNVLTSYNVFPHDVQHYVKQIFRDLRISVSVFIKCISFLKEFGAVERKWHAERHPVECPRRCQTKNPNTEFENLNAP